MNHFDARAVFDGTHWIGEFRPAHKADYEAVQDCGEVMKFARRWEAQIAADAALRAVLNRHYVSYRAQVEHDWQAGTIFRDGRKIEVTTK
jgi:hypothetical protein